jgi:iron complex outermembrane receptor protein
LAQKTSVSLAALAGDGLIQRGVWNVASALEGIPALNSSRQPDGVSINVRGLGADMPSGTTQGSVALEFDGVYSIMALGTGIGWFDIDRVELSKGPQSTRFGPNAEGGVVNVITRAPQLGDASGTVTVAGGSALLARGEFGQNIPLGDTVALRISGMAMRRGSTFSPPLGDLSSASLRGQLLVAPASGVELRLTAELSHIGGTGSGAEADTPFVVDKVAPYAGDSINATGNPWSQGDKGGSGMDLSRNHADLWQKTLSLRSRFALSAGADADLTLAHLAIAGDQTICPHTGAPWLVSGPGSCYVVHEFAPFRQNSAELRLHSGDGAARRWTLGGYAWGFDKSGWAESDQSVAGPAGGSQVGARTLALFAETTLPVAPQWRIVAGLRQSWDHRVLRPAGVATTYSADFAHADFRFGYERDIGAGLFHYTTLSSGYRPGGLTYDGNAAVARGFASQTTLALESGVKGQLGTWLRFDLAAFAYRQRHYQDVDNYNGFTVTLPTGQVWLCAAGGSQPAACSVPVFTISGAHNVGLEWNVELRPGPDDELSFSGAAMDARFDSRLAACATVAAPQTGGCWIGYNDQIDGTLRFIRIDGTAQPHAPALSLNARLAHTFHVARQGALRIEAQISHSSGYWVGPVQDAALLGWQPAYSLVGLSARYAPSGGRLSLSAYGRNLANYAVKMSALPATTIGDPRQFGLSATLAW